MQDFSLGGGGGGEEFVESQKKTAYLRNMVKS